MVKNEAALLVSLMVSLFVLCVLSSTEVVPRVLECHDALRMLSPCKAYLDGMEDEASSRCCWEVRNVVLRANSQQIRSELCNCFKLYMLQDTAIILGRAKSLCAKCRQPDFHPFPSVPDCGRVS